MLLRPRRHLFKERHKLDQVDALRNALVYAAC